jgi:hypothetical protein
MNINSLPLLSYPLPPPKDWDSTLMGFHHDVSRHGRTQTHYMTQRSHRKQKHKFGVTSPGALLVGYAWAYLSMKIVHEYFAPQTHLNALCELQIASEAKTHVRRNVSRCRFYGICIGPT